MTRDITIAAVQSLLRWEDRESNLSMFERQLQTIQQPVDLVVLPEMFTTGFSMKPEKFFEEPDGVTTEWMRKQAARMKAVITGSIIVKENGKYFNRLLWVRPEGTVEKYDKRHLFRMGEEEQHFSAGDKKLIVDLHGWKICPLVCYDLRFPVWSRNRWKKNGDELTADYDVLIYVANWPEVRSNAWKTLLQARALENLCYVVGVNRIGNDGNFIFHSGDSAIIDFKGAYLKSAIISKEEILVYQLSRLDIAAFRKNFPAGLDADEFRLES